jgi:hypothetical protein
MLNPMHQVMARRVIKDGQPLYIAWLIRNWQWHPTQIENVVSAFPKNSAVGIIKKSV